ncbi:hypothetical protein EON80_01750 [bacterium]|nr:MAG: hypothetical protein EON80_01750 [bacterium]
MKRWICASLWGIGASSTVLYAGTDRAESLSMAKGDFDPNVLINFAFAVVGIGLLFLVLGLMGKLPGTK